MPRVEADDVPRALAFAAAAVYGHPTFALDVVGITGTNGKTTTAHLVAALRSTRAAGAPGIVGTLGYALRRTRHPPRRYTSPEADELARIAAAMRARGATHLVMEVSSIALAAARVDAVRFRVAAFTNLTQDHLDYHGTMEAYAEAKARLFFELAPGAAAINVDDPFGASSLAGSRRRAAAHERRSRASRRGDAAQRRRDRRPSRSRTRRPGSSSSRARPRATCTSRSPLIGAPQRLQPALAPSSIAWLLDLDVGARGRGALARRSPWPGGSSAATTRAWTT